MWSSGHYGSRGDFHQIGFGKGAPASERKHVQVSVSPSSSPLLLVRLFTKRLALGDTRTQWAWARNVPSVFPTSESSDELMRALDRLWRMQAGELLLIKTNPINAAAEVVILTVCCAFLLLKGRFQRALRTVIRPNPSVHLISDSCLRVMRNMCSISRTNESRKQRRPPSNPCFFSFSVFTRKLMNSSAAQVFNLITAVTRCC